MKVQGLDGKEYNFRLIHKQSKNPSKLHLRARLLLTNLFPCDIMYEEVTLPGSRTPRNRVLRADFFLPGPRLVVEVQGEQHYKFNAHFYSNKVEYAKAISRDGIKQQWCWNNDIEIVYLPYMEDDDDWTKRINSR